ncbi:MAG: hypothetical protein JWQ21_580 [Herminiimonas sp.]|nr:hypothetical protein [Herminiimonas sp.]
MTTGASEEIEIRTFASIEEIRKLENFVEGGPLSKGDYKRLLGDYHLPEEVHCCYQKENKKLCGEAHKHGWVVLRRDEKATIIGGDCARDKFGADSKLVADSHRYINEKRRRERLATMRELIPLKGARIGQLAALRTSLLDLDRRVKSVTNELGPVLQRRLRDMVRTRQSAVVINAVKRRDYIDTDGKQKQEVSTFAHTLGALGGLDLVAPGSFQAVYDAVNNVVRAHQRAEEIAAEIDISRKNKEIDSVTTALQQYERILQDGQKLIELDRVFQDNNFALLCFLTDDKGERNKAAKLAMRRARVDRNTDPGAWLSVQEEDIRRRLQVDAIKVR